jgi:starch synthase
MSKKQIKVLFLSAEIAPLAKAGGLGDVAGALPKALFKLGVDIRLCLPFYGSIDVKKYQPKKIVGSFLVPVDHKKERVGLWQVFLPGTRIPVYLIKHGYFVDKNIYVGDKNQKENKNTLGLGDINRFAFFTRASLEAARVLNFQPDIIHAQDWHTGLAGDMIKKLKVESYKVIKSKMNATEYGTTKELKVESFYPEYFRSGKLKGNKEEIEFKIFFENTKVIYTIHNLASQGIAAPEIIRFSKIDPNLPVIKADLKNGDINMMVQGIMSSDIINTVSPTYAKEILHHYEGAGLDNILKKRKKDLYGVLNGIDTKFFNPKTDKNLAAKYDLKSLDKKVKNKLALQKKLGWKPDKNIPLVGLVTRLVWQKGIELITEEFAKLPCQFIFLGTGQPEYENHLKELAQRFPDKFSVQIKFDNDLAQLIYAASDIFLVPSRFEPCGLTQMIAMRYGSVPVARKTGGLCDSIKNYELRITNLFKNKATGFLFKEYKSEKFYQSLKKALDIYYHKPKVWRTIQINGMKKDFSWDGPAKEYLKLYKKLHQ